MLRPDAGGCFRPAAGVLEIWPESHWQGFALSQADVLQSRPSARVEHLSLVADEEPSPLRPSPPNSPCGPIAVPSVQEKINGFFGGLAHRADEVGRRFRTVLQARVYALMMNGTTPLPSPTHVDPTLALV